MTGAPVPAIELPPGEGEREVKGGRRVDCGRLKKGNEQEWRDVMEERSGR